MSAIKRWISAATDAHNANAGAHGGLAFTGARHKVQLGRGAVVAFVGDSTWVQADTPMPQLLARKIGALESCNAGYQVWDDTRQTYLGRTSEHAAAASSEVEFSPAQPGKLYTSGVDLTTGSVEIVAEIWPSTISGLRQRIVGQWGAQPAYSLLIQADGTLGFEWCDGTEPHAGYSTVALASFTAYRFVRARFIGSTGTLDFATSPDGATWTALGAQVTGAAVPIRANSLDPIEVGVTGETYDSFSGKIRRVMIRDGVDGHAIVPDSLAAWNIGVTYPNTYPRVSPTPDLLVLNASKGGTDYGYWADSTRIARALPKGCVDLVIIGLGHNLYAHDGADFAARLNDLAGKVATACPDAQIAWAIQTPCIASPRKQMNAQRNAYLVKWAVKNGYAVIDTCAPFARRAGGYSDLLVDDVHPSQEGHQFLTDYMSKLWGWA